METIQEREQEFRKEVYAVGGMEYTKTMLDRFADFWAEPDRAKGVRQKMKFEKQKTWHTNLRLKTWARNNFDKIQTHLSESQKTIQQKKKAFAESLQPYLKEYGTQTLNQFYGYWSAPENKPNPEFLRFEREEFWDLGARLKQWSARNNVAVNPMMR